MSLPAAERAKRYREKKNVVRNSDNLYRKAQCRTMKVMDSFKNAERLKKRELPRVHKAKQKERKCKLLYHNHQPCLQQSLHKVH